MKVKLSSIFKECLQILCFDIYGMCMYMFVCIYIHIYTHTYTHVLGLSIPKSPTKCTFFKILEHDSDVLANVVARHERVVSWSIGHTRFFKFMAYLRTCGYR